MHLLGIVSLVVTDYTAWHFVGMAVLWLLFGGYGIAVGHHKYFSHKSFETYRWVEKCLAMFGLMTMAGSVLFWATYHRSVHHRYADKEQDLHSPKRGLWKSFIWWQNDIRADTINPLAGRDLMRDPFLMWQHKHQVKLFWFVVLVTACVSWQFALGVLVPAVILSHHQDNLINVFGHLRATGYRNFDTDDNSVNNLFMGWFFWGQGWHNNHHALPGRLDYGVRWWEFDAAAKVLVPLIRKHS